MRALALRLRPDGRRERTLVHDWPAPPAPAGNEVRTQTLYTGMTNGTERNQLLGGNYAQPDEALPSAWGYQNVGRVIEVGPEVRDLRVGDLLYMSAEHLEYTVVAEDSLLVKLPPEIEPVQAALFGIGSVAVRTCRHADLRLGEQVLVVGTGLVGQLATQVARAMGARVTLCDVDAARLDLARGIGAAEELLDVSGDGWEANVAEGRFAAVIDAAGVPGMEDRLIAAARVRGQVLFIAGRSRVSYTFNLGQGREITIRQNSHFDRDDLAALIPLVRGGAVRVGPLLRDVVPVAEATAFYDRLRDRPQTLLGTVFIW